MAVGSGSPDLSCRSRYEPSDVFFTTAITALGSRFAAAGVVVFTAFRTITIYQLNWQLLRQPVVPAMLSGSA